MQAPCKPKLTTDKFDVNNFSTQFTCEAVKDSIIPDARKLMISRNRYKFDGYFNEFDSDLAGKSPGLDKSSSLTREINAPMPEEESV